VELDLIEKENNWEKLKRPDTFLRKIKEMLLLQKHSRSVLRRFIEEGFDFCYLSAVASAKADSTN
jgi:hypothetical protein